MNQSEQNLHNRIPISVSLDESFDQPDLSPSLRADKKRLLYISALAVAIGLVISVLAKLLVYLINLVTNLSFHSTFSIAPSTPVTHHYGAWVIFIPAIGGLIVG